MPQRPRAARGEHCTGQPERRRSRHAHEACRDERHADEPRRRAERECGHHARTFQRRRRERRDRERAVEHAARHRIPREAHISVARRVPLLRRAESGPWTGTARFRPEAAAPTQRGVRPENISATPSTSTADCSIVYKGRTKLQMTLEYRSRARSDCSGWSKTIATARTKYQPIGVS